jgi:hypothetical protein
MLEGADWLFVISRSSVRIRRVAPKNRFDSAALYSCRLARDTASL